MAKQQGRRRGRPASLARQLASDYMESRMAPLPDRLSADTDVELMPDDPQLLKHLIGDLQFENDLLRGIIARGGGASLILDEC